MVAQKAMARIALCLDKQKYCVNLAKCYVDLSKITVSTWQNDYVGIGDPVYS